MRIAVVAGKFDPIHAGHLDSIIKAAKLGDYLAVITHTDEVIERTSSKKFCAIPLEYRTMMLRGILLDQNIKGEVIVGIDEDGTCVKTLQRIRQLNPKAEIIFAKGGDRIPSTMNKVEIKVCKECNIEIRYCIGDLLNSSSKILARMNNKVED
jgi:cytidyltransferase-like protein